ncbi:DoxX family protein [Dyadobacter arcticus]|uniref:Membrane protein YphA (DoxX/SURF4 family) n=1 Tax=Dyadobacter arcticus TaxID=1078754 RepID=A0ABX0UN61_9BACT|nr:DoxX family protein [Dyadobacter arcticus]NIJ53893.1 putative membrane protein YphA (DoxX/SURF4 family) [Dyadobacter arcticus]
MKKTKIIYWILTGLLSVMLGIGSVYDAISAPEAVEHVTRIGYPTYLVPFLGVMKILGIIAILIPGYPRIKEWAYAGLAYDMFGALYSHVAFGDGVQMWGGLIVGLVLLGASYFYYHKKESEVSLAI